MLSKYFLSERVTQKIMALEPYQTAFAKKKPYPFILPPIICDNTPTGRRVWNASLQKNISRDIMVASLAII